MGQRIVIEIGPKMGQEVPIRIVEQTYRGEDFGLRGFFRCDTSPIKLVSNGMPEWAGCMDGVYKLYVRGSDRTKDNKIVGIPLERIEDLKKAVIRFNELSDKENKDSGIVYVLEKWPIIAPTNPNT